MSRKQKRANKKNKDQYEYNTMECTSAFILNVKISKSDLSKVQSYSEQLFNSDDDKKVDASFNLVGEIPSGEELKVDPNDIRIKEFCEKIRVISKTYIDEYCRRIIKNPQLTGIAHDSIWLNSYGKGDYNPYHDHTTETPMGLSWFLYVKVPNSMNTRIDDGSSGRLEGALGGRKYHNGCTALHWGYNFHDSATSYGSFLIPPMFLLNPEEGQLYMFPKWLKHQVYPHTCDENRISMAGNLSIF